MSKENQITPVGEQNISEARKYTGGFISPDCINVLPQGRKTFDQEELQQLAEDIAEEGLMSPPIVVGIAYDKVEEYISPFNEIWNADIQNEDLTATTDTDGQKTYIFLVAGERRYRACRILFDESRGDGEKAEIRRNQLKDIFGTEHEMEVRYLKNNTPENALYRQAAENTYVPIKPDEEAVYYDRMYKVFKRTNPTLTIAQFAKKVSRSEQKVRTALRFCCLPEDVQEDVRNGNLQYGYAVELSRLIVLNDSAVFDFYRERARSTRLTIDEFRNLISEYISQNNTSQMNMEDIFLQSQMLSNEQRIRKVVAKDLIHSTWAAISYLDRLLTLFGENKVGIGLPFSEESPLRVHRALIQYQRQLLPHLQGLLNSNEVKDSEQILEESYSAVNSLIEQVEHSQLAG